MRVALSALSVKPGRTGGGETVLRNLLRHLPQADPSIEYLLFVTQENRSLFGFGAANLVLEVAPAWVNSPARRITYEFVNLPVIAQRRGVDLFLAINQIFSPLLRCPVVAFVQNLLYYHYRDFYHYSDAALGIRAWLGLELRNLFFGLLNGSAARRAAHLIAVSETVRREIACHEGLPLEKITAIPLAVSGAIGPPCSAARDEPEQNPPPMPSPYFLMVGALEPYKNIDLAIAALARLRHRCGAGQARLVVLGLNGHGYDRQLRRVAIEMGVAEAVSFPEAVPHERLWGWYRDATALLLLSACEAFPLPPFEAMACGTPVIASNLSSVPEVIGEGGVTVDPGNTEQVADIMYRVMTDTETRTAMIERGHRWVERYSWEQTALRIAALLRAQTP